MHYNTFPEFYYSSNFTSTVSRSKDNWEYFYHNDEIQRLVRLENIYPEEFFGGLSATSNLNSGRNNILMDKLIKSSQEIDTTITNEILLAVSNATSYFYIATNGETPEFINTATRPDISNLRIFAYDGYPNDSMGFRTGLSTTSNFSTPMHTVGHAGTQNFVGNWDANYIFFNGFRSTVDNDTTYLSRYLPECDVDPGFSCKLNLNLTNWVAEPRYFDEYYRLDSINGSTIDSYIDIYFFDRYNNGVTSCRHTEAAVRAKEEGGAIKYNVLSRYLESLFDGSTCVGWGYRDWFNVFGYEYTDEYHSYMYYYTESAEGYFEPIRFYYPLNAIGESNLTESSTIDSNFSYYLDNHSVEASVSNIESTIIRLLSEGFSNAYARFAYSEEPSDKRNWLLILKFNSFDISQILCYVNGVYIVDITSPNNTQLYDTIDTCLPYLQPGYESPDPYNPIDYSPYVGSGPTSSSFNEYDLLRETERMHQEVMQKYGLIEEPIIEQDKQIPLKKKSKYLKPISD